MLKVGDICRTNISQSGGLVRILDLDEQRENCYCYIEFIENHPYGYAKGDKGVYFKSDLIFVESGGNHEAAIP